MEDHTAYIYILSLYPFLMEFFFFFSLHKAHTFTRPDIFCNVWKRWGDAVPMGKLLFLPVRLRDVNVPISWRTKFRLKVTCLFPCAVEGGWFVRSYKMKESNYNPGDRTDQRSNPWCLWWWLIKANNGSSVPYECLFGLRMQLYDLTQAHF